MDDWRKYKNIDDYQHRIDLELQELKNSPVKITPRLKYYTENYAIRCEDAERYRIRAYKLLEEAVKDEEVLFKLQNQHLYFLYQIHYLYLMQVKKDNLIICLYILLIFDLHFVLNSIL